MKSIVIFIDYFGQWPKWFPVFLASCKYNSTVNWIIRTDCEIPREIPGNVKFIGMSFADYVKNVSDTLNLNFQPHGNYKVCDVRPAYGELYKNDMHGFDYYGFGDLDVIYGNIRKFYDEDVLSCDVISTHESILSGHLSIFKNTEMLRKAYLNIPNWAEYIENPESSRFDEDIYSHLFIENSNPERTINFVVIPGLKTYFKEQYTTVFHPMRWHDGMADHPEVWFWKDGLVTNDRNEGRDYLYLHLMNFQSMRWTNEKCRRERTPWKHNAEMLFTKFGEEINGVTIGWQGIQPLSLV